LLRKGPLNDLWRIDAEALTWNLVNGNPNASTIDSYSGNVSPGGRLGSSMTLLSNESILLFGGTGWAVLDGLINEMWRLDLVVNNWFFVNGETGVNGYGDNSTSGNGYPGPRAYHSTTLLSNDSLILFGGYGNSFSGYSGLLNELWRFDSIDNTWWFINGNSSINIPEDIYYPGSRKSQSLSTLFNGSIILFGGEGIEGNFN